MKKTKLPLWLLKNPEQATLLRQVAAPIPLDTIQTPAIQQLIDDMLVTMPQAHGVGLAAPQVGQSLRLAVVDAHVQTHGQPLVMINPAIAILGQTQDLLEEGCLSIPKVFGPVSRPVRLRLTACDRTGQPYTLVAKGFLARVIQHEVDHLNGRLFIDRASQITSGNIPA